MSRGFLKLILFIAVKIIACQIVPLWYERIKKAQMYSKLSYLAKEDPKLKIFIQMTI